MTFNCREGGLNRTCQTDFIVIPKYRNLKKIVLGGEGKKEVSYKTV